MDVREQAWFDGLTNKQQAVAARVMEMPERMAVAWVAIEVVQLREDVVLKNGSSPNGRTQSALALLGGAVGSGMLASAAIVARVMGWA